MDAQAVHRIDDCYITGLDHTSAGPNARWYYDSTAGIEQEVINAKCWNVMSHLSHWVPGKFELLSCWCSKGVMYAVWGDDCDEKFESGLRHMVSVCLFPTTVPVHWIHGDSIRFWYLLEARVIPVLSSWSGPQIGGGRKEVYYTT